MQENISCLLVQVARSHRSRTGACLAKVGLHVGQEMVMLQLWEEDGLIQSELVSRIQVEAPTVTKMLNRIEGAGLVERRRDPQDARICRVYLTDQGQALREPVNLCWQAIENRVLANMTLEEQLLLRRLLLQMLSNLA